MTLEDLLKETYIQENGRTGSFEDVHVDHTVSIQEVSEIGVHFIIHPAVKNGKTLDLVVKGNELSELELPEMRIVDVDDELSDEERASMKKAINPVYPDCKICDKSEYEVNHKGVCDECTDNDLDLCEVCGNSMIIDFDSMHEDSESENRYGGENGICYECGYSTQEEKLEAKD